MYSPTDPQACRAAFVPPLAAVAGNAGIALGNRLAVSRSVLTIALLDICILHIQKSFTLRLKFEIASRRDKIVFPA
jgi:hypothetical protein